MIKRLVIHRFRGIHEGVLDDLGKINLFIGPNNSGKTAILEMLYMAGVSGRPCNLIMEDIEPSAFDARTLAEHDFLGEEPMPRLRLRHGEPRLWKNSPASLKADDGSLGIQFLDIVEEFPLNRFFLAPPLYEPGEPSTDFTKNDPERISMLQLRQQEKIPDDIIPSLFNEKNLKPDQSIISYLWESPWVYKWERENPLDHFAVWAATGKMPDAPKVLFFDFHTANQHFNERFTQWAKNTIPDWYEKIAQKLSLVFPELEEAIIEIDNAPDNQPGESGYIRFSGKTRLPIDHFGDGARHAFKVLAGIIPLAETVTKENPGLFLWEDPELFMHPATLGRLLEEVIKILKDKPIQVFITTQSLDVLAWMANSLDKNSSLSANFNTYSLKLQTTGILDSRLFRGKRVNEWLLDGFDPRDTETGMVDISPISWRLKSEEEEELLW